MRRRRRKKKEKNFIINFIKYGRTGKKCMYSVYYGEWRIANGNGKVMRMLLSRFHVCVCVYSMCLEEQEKFQWDGGIGNFYTVDSYQSIKALETETPEEEQLRSMYVYGKYGCTGKAIQTID